MEMRKPFYFVIFSLQLIECYEDDGIYSVDVFPRPSQKRAKLGQFGSVYRDGRVSDDGHNDPAEDLAQLPRKVNYEDGFADYEEKKKRRRFNEEKGNITNIVEKERNWFDFSRLQEQSIMRHFNVPAPKRKPDLKYLKGTNKTQDYKSKKVTPKETSTGYNGKMRYFQSSYFNLEEDNNTRSNNPHFEEYTTCDEFKKGAKFHPDDIMDLEWIPFFIWSTHNFLALGHKFSTPTVKLVKEFKQTYASLITEPINWEQPKILLQTIKYEILLIAVDSSGLFYGLPKVKLPSEVEGIKFPVWTVRLKIVDPYLMLMHCDIDDPYCAIMAVEDQFPRTIEESVFYANATKFKGPGLPVRKNNEYEQIIKEGERKLKERATNSERLQVHPYHGMFGPQEVEDFGDRMREDGDRMWFDINMKQIEALNDIRMKNQRKQALQGP